MFNNVGRKLMVFAKIVCWAGILASLVGGINIMMLSRWQVFVDYPQRNLILDGLLVIVVGSLLSWLISLGLYALGEVHLMAMEDREKALLKEQNAGKPENAPPANSSNAKMPSLGNIRPLSSSEKTWTWTCPHCSSSNPGDALYCKNCGKYK